MRWRLQGTVPKEDTHGYSRPSSSRSAPPNSHGNDSHENSVYYAFGSSVPFLRYALFSGLRHCATNIRVRRRRRFLQLIHFSYRGPPGKSISRTAPDDGRDYYSKSTTYFEWLLGFVTGYNAAVKDTGKKIQLDPAAVDLYVRSWCAQNPTSNIFTAAHQFLNKADP